MTAAAKIAEARALIEPLTGHTPGPWGYRMSDVCADGIDGDDVVLAGIGRSYGARSHEYTLLRAKSPQHAANGKLMAAAPALRDTVAALADLADAQAQEIERLRSALEWYAEQSCELGRSHECCGRLAEFDCDGCRARAALGDAP